MPIITRCRHIGYTANGNMCLMRDMPVETGCLGTIDIMAGRFIDYGATSGAPVVVTSTECCDVVDNEEDSRQALDCWYGIGITKNLRAHVGDLASCWKMRDTWFDLGWANETPPFISEACQCPNATQHWAGSLSMPGGTQNFYLCCEPSDDPDLPGTFQLLWQGCQSGCASSQSLGDCPEPFIFNAGNVDLPDCCTCQAEHTDVTAGITINIYGNCRKVVWARHIDYMADGTPIVARERRCPYDRISRCECAIMECGLCVTVTALDDPEQEDTIPCLCMDGFGGWVDKLPGPGPGTEWFASASICGVAGTVSVQCSATDDPDIINIAVGITCGADNIANGSIDIPACDIDVLDVTIGPIDMTWGGDPHCTTCSYRYNEMAHSWLAETPCEGDCACPDPPSEPGFDGQLVTLDCTPTVTVPCCVGPISVRIQRDNGGSCPSLSLLSPDAPPAVAAPAPAGPGPDAPPAVTALAPAGPGPAAPKKKGCGCKGKLTKEQKMKLLNR